MIGLTGRQTGRKVKFGSFGGQKYPFLEQNGSVNHSRPYRKGQTRANVHITRQKTAERSQETTGAKSTSEVVRLDMLDRISAKALNRLAKHGGYDPNFGRAKREADSES